MIITEKKVQEVEETIEIICDKCQKKYDIDDIFEIQEFCHIKFTGGYASVFGDGNMVECDICQHCLLEIIKDFCRIDDSW